MTSRNILVCSIYFVLALVQQVECQTIQILNVTELADSIYAGQELILSCIVKYDSMKTATDGDTEVTWNVRSTKLSTNGRLQITDDFTKDGFGRLKLGSNITALNLTELTREVNLIFPHILTNDSDVYTCKTSTGDGKTSTGDTNVSVIDPLMSPAVGDDITVECDGITYGLDNNVSISKSVIWTIDSNGATREVVCGDGATTNALDSGTTPPHPSENSTNPLSVSTFEPVATLAERTTIASQPSRDIVCDGLSQIKVLNAISKDDGKYTCTYNYTSNMIPYKWIINVLVRDFPMAPGKPQPKSSEQDSITIFWNASVESETRVVHNYSIQYITEYSYNQTGGWKTLISNIKGIPKSTLEYQIDNLAGSTNYVARVLAWNDVGSTPSETNFKLMTKETLPTNPTPFVPKVDKNQVTLEWFIDSGTKVSEFLLLLYEGSNPEKDHSNLELNVTILGNATSEPNKYMYIVSNLTASKDYCFTVQTVYMRRHGVDPNCMAFKTDRNPPDVPFIKEIEKSNSTGSVLITFEPPECILKSSGCLNGYKIQYKTLNASGFMNKSFGKDEATSDGVLRSYEFFGLAPGNTYEMKLAGVVQSMIDSKKRLTGKFSNIISIELPQGDPPTFPAPPLDNISPSSEVTTTIATTLSPPPPTTLPTGRTTPREGEGPDTTTIILVVVFSIVIIVTVVIIAVVCYRKRKVRGDLSLEMEEDLWIDLNTPLLGPASMGYVDSGYENIDIDEWADHCKLMHANSDIKFTEEYESICKSVNQELSWKDSLEPANLPKNRYNNIVAYDHTRVVLKTHPGIVHSDYINANYIDSYDKARAFIATQGPLPNTIDDFWRMIWENNSSVIVMITNVYEKHKKKCEQYWPDKGEAKYGRLTVTALKVEELAHWTIRTFTIKNTKVSKKKHMMEKYIMQYHYTEWPDHGIPEYTLPVLSFVKRACASSSMQSGPIVVHCSAGVGRTGTFIALEAMMKQIMQKRNVNVQGFLRHIRRLRNHLVQTEDQYIFIHDALLNFIESGGRTDITPTKFKTVIDELDSNFDNSGETILKKQYKTIVRWSPPDHLTNCALLDVNQLKNRSMAFIPLDNSSRVKLPKVAGETGSDYINATYLHGYFQNKEFIITQHPAASTEYDFWRMVWDQNSMTVVMLSNIGEEDLITFFRPKGEPTDWSHKCSFKVTFTEENLDMLDYAVRDFQLESKQDDYEMLMRMFSITCWPEAYSETEKHGEGVFQFIEVVNKWHATKRNQTGPIIVIDKCGGKVAAQFCALYTLYNQCHNDSSVDMYSLAYLYHMKRPGVWETQDDYRLLYNSMLQLCDPLIDDEKASDSLANGRADYSNFAHVRRINTLPRSPEHIIRTDTL